MTLNSRSSRESLAMRMKNAPINITPPQKAPLEKYRFVLMVWSSRAMEGVSYYNPWKHHGSTYHQREADR
jgi:hypothetical protein